MSITGAVQRDERTVAVEQAAGQWAFLILSYCLLLDIAYRSLVRHEAAWDLMALVIGGGALSAAYQARKNVLNARWVIGACVAAAVAALLALLLVLIS
jgi:hypothetical protein